MKLMFVGQANKGKTSLLLNLTRKAGKMVHYCRVDIGKNDKPLSTPGVDLGEYIYSPHAGKPAITFMTWDFGGQVYIKWCKREDIHGLEGIQYLSEKPVYIRSPYSYETILPEPW